MWTLITKRAPRTRKKKRCTESPTATRRSRTTNGDSMEGDTLTKEEVDAMLAGVENDVYNYGGNFLPILKLDPKEVEVRFIEEEKEL